MIEEKLIKVIEKTLHDMNYDVQTLLFKAKDFGVPQNRERVYIVGFDKAQVKNYKDFKPPVPFDKPTKVGDVLEESVNEKYTIQMHYGKDIKEEKGIIRKKEMVLGTL